MTNVIDFKKKSDSIYTVNLKLIWLESFTKELTEFPPESKEDILSLIDRFLAGERLTAHDFKTFKIDQKTKIQEFRVKDHHGNWRAISTIVQGKYLVLVYAFHKKSQELQEKDKKVIRNRIKRIDL